MAERRNTFWFILISWLPLPFLGVANGVVREYTYGPGMGEQAAHQVSSVILIILITIYVLILRRQVRLPLTDAAATGFMWLLLTVAFEFGFGLLVAGATWGELIADYDLGGGRLWVAVLLWTAVAPWLLLRERGERY